MRCWFAAGLGVLLGACSPAQGLPNRSATPPPAGAVAAHATPRNATAAPHVSDAALRASDVRALDVGDSFVDFGLPELELVTGTLGRIIWLSEFVGDAPRTTAKRALLLNFFATWCAPCVAEFAVLNRWQQAYAAQGLQVVSVNFRLPDAGVQQTILDTLELLHGREVVFPLLFDRYTQRNQLAYLGTRAVLPTNLLIGADGKVLARSRGTQPLELEGLERRLRMVLGVESDAGTAAAPHAPQLSSYASGNGPPL